jgi:hypothetical protein
MKQLFTILEQNLFIHLSVHMKLPTKETEFHIKKIHTKILKQEMSLSDLSDRLQFCYEKYLDFLNIEY